jgi:uncharacterized protein (TIGR04255 family)
MSDLAAPSVAPVEIEVFPRAPVTEAILAIEVPFLDDLTVYAESFHEAVKDAFPEREPVDILDSDDFPWPARGGPHRAGRKGEPDGFRLISADRLQVVQVTRRALTYHRLRPYVDWGHFTAGAVPVWQAFSTVFSPEYVASLRLRYLNRIEVPLPFRDLDDYLTMLPKVPKPVDTGFTGYLLRITLWDPRLDAYADVTQIAEPEANVPMLPVIFDIDVRMNTEIPPDDRSVWDAVEGLREYKNRIFFSSITDATRSLFR